MERVLINSRFGKYKVIACKPVNPLFDYGLRIKCLKCGSVVDTHLIFGRIMIVKCCNCDNSKHYIMPIGDNGIKGYRSLSEYYYKKYRGQVVKEGIVGNADIFNRINEMLIDDLKNDPSIKIDNE